MRWEIDSLVRKDIGGKILIQLSYAYLSSSNKLASIKDVCTEAISSTYTYDGNGNMVSDSKKGITLSYNYLDLPDTIKQATSTLVFTYDAGGRKLYKQLLVSGAVISQRHYVEDVEVTATSSIAKDGQVDFATIPGGKLMNTGGGNMQLRIKSLMLSFLGQLNVAKNCYYLLVVVSV